MPSSKSNNGYAFGPNNTNAAISNTNSSKNPFISNTTSHSTNQSGALPIPSSSTAAAYQQQGGRPSPSRSLTGGGHSPLLANYDRGDHHQQDGSGNRLLGAGMSRQGSADSMGSAVSFIDVVGLRSDRLGNVVADDDGRHSVLFSAIQPQLSPPLSLGSAVVPISFPYSLILRLPRFERTGRSLCEHQLERRIRSKCYRCSRDRVWRKGLEREQQPIGQLGTQYQRQV